MTTLDLSITPPDLALDTFSGMSLIAERFAAALGTSRSPMVVNDVHSRLNATPIRCLLQPSSLDELTQAVREAAAARASIAISGGKHAMGGQQFLANALLLDMRNLRKILGFDPDRGRITVEAGICWPGLFAELESFQPRSPAPWSIVQKQTGADDLTLGGALSANIHGRGLSLRPFVQDVLSFDLVNAAGQLLHCSRSHNAELFSLAIGGYGLFGVIYSVTLQLQRRYPLQRLVQLIDIEDFLPAVEARIQSGCTYGDFQFAIDPTTDDFLRKGVLSCYAPTEAQPPSAQRSLSPADWDRLLNLAHTEKSRGFEEYSRYYLSTHQQVYWSDTHQLSYYPSGYHEALDGRLGNTCPGSEMISELYVPRAYLPAWMNKVQGLARNGRWNIIYGTVRLIERDTETFLPWARESWACVVFNLCVQHSPEGIAHAKRAFQSLIDSALEFGGSFYLTYHRWAATEQLLACYPQLPEFLRLKSFYDPAHVFSSNWHRHYGTSLAHVIPPQIFHLSPSRAALNCAR